MNLTLLRLGLSNVKRHPWLTLFLILGVTLGVAVIVAIDIANQSAMRSFSMSLESVSGKTTHRIVGGSQGIDEKIYSDLKIKLNVAKCAPVISNYVNVGRDIKLIGIDIFAEAPFRSYVNRDNLSLSDDAFVAFSQQERAVILSQQLATELNTGVGKKIDMEFGGQRIPVSVVAVISPQDPFVQKSLSGIMITDISSAQEIFGSYGRLSHVDLIIEKNIVETLKKIRNILPEEARIEELQQSNRKTQHIISSFQLNLSALSLLAILIGAFIIYDTVTFSVVRRRHVIGVLRSVGATKRNIFMMIMGETCVMALVGVFCGFFLGVVLAKFAVTMVMQTINDLYFTLTVTDFSIAGTTILKSLLGVAIALVAALIPSVEAAKIPPVGMLRRSVLESKIHAYLSRFTLSGIALLCLGVVVFFIPSKSLILGFIGISLVILGASLCVPLLLLVLMKLISLIAAKNNFVIVKMAARSIERSLSRTSVAVAALTVAVSCLIAINIMIGSFRITFINWIDSVLTAEIFVSGDNKGIARAKEFSRELAAKVAQVDGVKSISLSRITDVKSQTKDIVRLNAVTRNIANRGVFSWTHKNIDGKWNDINERSIVVSEPFAYRYNMAQNEGNSISLYTDKGLQEFHVVGIYVDYASDRGQILMADEVYRHYWKDDKITAIAVFLKDGYNRDSVGKEIEKSLEGYEDLVVNPSENLREIALNIFDRTFAITFAMQILVGFVAFIGIISTLMALQLERKKEIGILRANGMTPRQLRKLVYCETGLMGAVAGIISIPLGFAVAVIFIYVINVRSFGWTIQFFPYAKYFVQGLVTAIIAATLAGIYPAWKFAVTNIASVLREE
ncbi:FtsX-like permease family protein [Candidatus Uabimicrobium amorphum]|uniref:Adhesion component ABC transporter permease n=1 Tax=Uabimicrobium amorphum TaxID=2596890 RepID=A0A5S9IU70_UABAM|nr:FtsX-like permease family protein [Candidatus Uabimicrobium amorphum]BBM88014.1 adhesion component ABC transporter permease [Candidatus Uabimicrobium amorphum]